MRSDPKDVSSVTERAAKDKEKSALVKALSEKVLTCDIMNYYPSWLLFSVYYDRH